MDFSSICRLCLGTESLNPIFEILDKYSIYATTLNNITGVMVSVNDNLPQQICTECIIYINNVLQYRKKCKHNQEILENMKERLPLQANSFEDNKSNVDVKSEIEIKIELDDEPDAELSEDDKPLTMLKDQDVSIKTEPKPPIRKRKIQTTHTEEPYITDMNTQKRVICKFCHKNLSIRSFDSHMTSYHPGSDWRKEKCELCDRFILKSKMARHRNLMHDVESRIYKCGYCKNNYEDKDALVKHVLTCTGKRKKRKTQEAYKTMVTCDICHKEMQKGSLRMHKAIKHNGLAPVCEHCGKAFGNKLRLLEHYRAKHGYEKFKCSLCDFESASAAGLQNHIRRHRGEKPFICESCGAKFHAAYLLAQHKQSHRTEKLLKCDLCPSSFKANNSLHMHKKTCHSKTGFKCSMCDRVYKNRHYAVKHLRQFHNYKGNVGVLGTVNLRLKDENDGEGI